MRKPKKPPPDNPGNVMGRIRALQTVIKQHASMAVKEGADPARALAKAQRQFEPDLKKLRARLAKVQKTTQTAPVPKAKTKKKASKATVKPQEAQKKRSAGTTVPADYDDLLAALGGL
jgi:hypothetical protein